MTSLIYTFFSILGLSFLIFIHELGHYWMARRVGMRVETFSIGFGRPIVSWMRDGVKWQIGWLIFGGYVKIAGTDTEDDKDPYEVKDGFFGKSPLDRIKVAFMGPFVNLVFALLVFVVLWGMGGREKNFSEFTNIIGWVDTQSELFLDGIRPGDELIAYDGVPLENQNDHIYAPLTADDEMTLTLEKVDYPANEKTAVELLVKPYKHPYVFDDGIKTAGILESGRYILYDKLPDGRENPLPEGSPMIGSGIEYGDRILWIDGELIFSRTQMNDILNDGRVLLTIQRGDKTLIRRVPRVHVQEFRPNAEFREELLDWQYEAGLKDKQFEYLYTIPYNLTFNCIVEGALKFVDKESSKEAFPENPFSDRDLPLQAGDKIIAIQGEPVKFSYQLLSQLQERKVNIIVERNEKAFALLPASEVDATFDQDVNWNDLAKVSQSIGTSSKISSLGNLRLLKPVTPKKQVDFYESPEKKAWALAELSEQKKRIEQLENPEQRAFEMQRYEKGVNDLVLGLVIQDRRVVFNPSPMDLFSSTASQIGRVLYSLVTFSLSPKHIAGPVGIVQMVQGSSMVSLKETLFWMGAISLNLGMLNLLPVPILDGGTIVFSFFEMITRRRMKPKVLEKVILVFAVLLFSFFIFITYNDLLRLLG